MKTKNEQRNDAVRQAYRYARVGALNAARTWVRRAVSFAPLTEMQLYRLRRYFGPETLEEITSQHLNGMELLIRGLERRLDGKP
jgi:hypothetical protein